ncbi:MAG: HAD family hydrolase [Leptospiraceae bacterium]|jgi:D-glycero-D-manno-heptose 1,7-bisphosphate phosphatase|nr:HAD family hydrolase [Leptospiraceae bacterium]
MNIIFLDRDNTINYDPGYLSDPNLVQILPYVIDGLKLLNNAGYEFIIITNQSGIGRGYYKEEDMHRVNQRILDILKSQNIFIKDIFFCPHTEEDQCMCRKPKPGLILQALEKYPTINLKTSWIIGDSLRDIFAGENLNIKGVLIDAETKPIEKKPTNLIYVAKNLKEAAECILKFV